MHVCCRFSTLAMSVPLNPAYLVFGLLLCLSFGCAAISAAPQALHPMRKTPLQCSRSLGVFQTWQVCLGKSASTERASVEALWSIDMSATVFPTWSTAQQGVMTRVGDHAWPHVQWQWLCLLKKPHCQFAVSFYESINAWKSHSEVWTGRSEWLMPNGAIVSLHVHWKCATAKSETCASKEPWFKLESVSKCTAAIL